MIARAYLRGPSDFWGTELDEAIEDLSAVRGDTASDKEDILDFIGVPHERVVVED